MFKPDRADEDVIARFQTLFNTPNPDEDIEMSEDLEVLAEFLGWLDPHWNDTARDHYVFSEWYVEFRARMRYFAQRTGLLAP